MHAQPELAADPRAQDVLDLLAAHAHVQAGHLQPDMPATELGLSQLELALALFDIEDHFDVALPSRDGAEEPTVGQLVQEVLHCLESRQARSW